MPDRPGLARTPLATARPRRVSSTAASAVEDSRSTFFGRLAQPETSKPRASATRKRETETDVTRATGLWAFICASTDLLLSSASTRQLSGELIGALRLPPLLEKL